MRERAQRGEWEPFSEQKPERMQKLGLRIFCIDASPSGTINRLSEQGYQNLANALMPIQITFPKMVDLTKPLSYEKMILSLPELGRMFSKLFKELNRRGLDTRVDAVQGGLTNVGLKLPFPT